jgi:two-component system, response regulator PdtaR
MIAMQPSDAPTIVLVVEDEPLQRWLSLEMVREAGFTPIEAADADEAIAILESRSDIRIVFTDIEMPGSMDGLRLARAIRGRWPPIELVLTSGRSAVREVDLPERGRFLAKPYQSHRVADILQQLAV